MIEVLVSTIYYSKFYFYAEQTDNRICCLFSLLVFRNDELTKMLDSSKDSLKLDAMKIVIGVSVHVERKGGGEGG